MIDHLQKEILCPQYEASNDLYVVFSPETFILLI